MMLIPSKGVLCPTLHDSSWLLFPGLEAGKAFDERWFLEPAKNAPGLGSLTLGASLPWAMMRSSHSALWAGRVSLSALHSKAPSPTFGTTDVVSSKQAWEIQNQKRRRGL